MQRKNNRCFRTTDEEWRQFHVAAAGNHEAVSDVLRRLMYGYINQEGEWRV